MRQNPFERLLAGLCDEAPELRGVLLCDLRGDELALSPSSARETLTALSVPHLESARRDLGAVLSSKEGSLLVQPFRVDGAGYLLLLWATPCGTARLRQLAYAVTEPLRLLLR